jgi:adenosylhomocysteine nucleosidase
MYALKQVGTKSILFVMAAEPEYGTQLKQIFSPLMCGVGPVESAVEVTHALAELSLRNDLPDVLVSLGSAGSSTLKQAEVYQATSVSYRDMDASPLGFEKGKTPFLDLPVENALPFLIPGVPTARLSTGANIVSGDAYKDIDAEMVDMESFAILRSCMKFDVPMVALRGISDGKEELKKLTDWTEYLDTIDQKLAQTVEKLFKVIMSGEIL